MDKFHRSLRQAAHHLRLNLWLFIGILLWHGIGFPSVSKAFSTQLAFPPSPQTHDRQVLPPSSPAPFDFIPHLFDRVERQLRELITTLTTGQATPEVQKKLHRLLISLQQADSAERTRLAHIAQRLHDRRFSPLLQQRHAEEAGKAEWKRFEVSRRPKGGDPDYVRHVLGKTPQCREGGTQEGG